MKIVKRCFFRTDTINVTPAILVTPLYKVNHLSYPFTLSDANTWPHREPDQRPPSNWYRGGFRLAFKFLCIHAGIEVHYD